MIFNLSLLCAIISLSGLKLIEAGPELSAPSIQSQGSVAQDALDDPQPIENLYRVQASNSAPARPQTRDETIEYRYKQPAQPKILYDPVKPQQSLHQYANVQQQSIDWQGLKQNSGLSSWGNPINNPYDGGYCQKLCYQLQAQWQQPIYRNPYDLQANQDLYWPKFQ